MSKDDSIDIELPKTLYNRIIKLSQELGIDDVNEFIIDLIRDSVSRIEMDLGREEYSEEEINRIKERLRSLGYLE